MPRKRGGGNARGKSKAPPPTTRIMRARKRARAEVDETEEKDSVEAAAPSQEDNSRDGSSEPFKFNLTLQLTKEQRLSWGIPIRFTYLVVNVAAETSPEKGKPTFCVHCVPKLKEADSTHHRPCSAGDEMPDSPVCFGEANLLTHGLCRELHIFLSKNPPNSAELHGIVTKCLDLNLTAACIVCKSTLGTSVSRPVACSVKCEKAFQLWPLEARFAPLLRDPQALDFMLCCVYTTHAAAHEPGIRGGRTPPEVTPFRREVLLEILDSFPEVTADSTLGSLLGSGRLATYRALLLDWLCATFKGAMITAAPKDQVPQFTPDGQGAQFVLLNSSFAHHKAFTAACTAPGIAGFHGTHSSLLLPILCAGLDGTSSAASGSGVWFAQDPSTSLRRYMCGHLWAWSKSAFRVPHASNPLSVLFGLELHHGTTFSDIRTGVTDSSMLAIRYVFVMPKSSVDVLAQGGFMDRSDMEKSFNRIRSGRIGYET